MSKTSKKYTKKNVPQNLVSDFMDVEGKPQPNSDGKSNEPNSNANPPFSMFKMPANIFHIKLLCNVEYYPDTNYGIFVGNVNGNPNFSHKVNELICASYKSKEILSLAKAIKFVDITCTVTILSFIGDNLTVIFALTRDVVNTKGFQALSTADQRMYISNIPITGRIFYAKHILNEKETNSYISVDKLPSLLGAINIYTNNKTPKIPISGKFVIRYEVGIMVKYF